MATARLGDTDNNELKEAAKETMAMATAAMMETAKVPYFGGGGGNVGGGSIGGRICHGVGNFCNVCFFKVECCAMSVK